MKDAIYNALTEKQKEMYSKAFVANVVKALEDWELQCSAIEDNQIRRIHTWVEDYLGEGGFPSKINRKDLKDMIKAYLS